MSIKTYFFALAVVQHPDGRYLLVNETANRGWWLPGGCVDPGEDLVQAAIRETKEEAGIDIEVTGILSVQHSPLSRRMRLIFYGRPINPNQPPKSVADAESVGAAWVTLDDLSNRPLRGSEPKTWFQYVHDGHPIAPVSLLGPEL